MSQVYFLLASSVNLIKIGRSGDPETRFEQLRLLSPVPLEIVGLIEGGSAVEAALHQRFDHLHSHGEWFHATNELRRFAWFATMESLWNRGSKGWREEFLSRIDTPVMDAADDPDAIPTFLRRVV